MKTAAEKEFDKRIKAFKKDMKDGLNNLLKEQKEHRLNSGMSQWKELTALKNKIEKDVGNNSICDGWNLKRISTMTDYYEYQHPDTPQLKSNDENVDWIVDFLKGNGQLTTLISTAEKSRVKIWDRMTSPAKKRNEKQKEQDEDKIIKKAKEIEKRRDDAIENINESLGVAYETEEQQRGDT